MWFFFFFFRWACLCRNEQFELNIRPLAVTSLAFLYVERFSVAPVNKRADEKDSEPVGVLV